MDILVGVEGAEVCRDEDNSVCDWAKAGLVKSDKEWLPSLEGGKPDIMDYCPAWEKVVEKNEKGRISNSSVWRRTRSFNYGYRRGRRFQ